MTAKQLYQVIGNIRYHNPDSPLNGELITPDMPEAKAGLEFPHLTDAEKKLLVRRRYLRPMQNEPPKGKS